MKKDLNEHRENLINSNERLQAIAYFLIRVVPDPKLLMTCKNHFYGDLGELIREEAERIEAILGTYEEAFPSRE